MAMPAVAGIASSALRNCCHACHAVLPVVGHPPRTCAQADVWKPTAPIRTGLFNSSPRAAITAHCLACQPLCV